MKNRTRMTVLAVFVLVAVYFIPASPCWAWGSIAHWIIANDAGSDPSYANLPDVWPSKSGIWVSEKFCWSHGAIDVNPGLSSPSVPIYPDDGRYPGFEMYRMAKYKLSPVSSTASKTAEGFVCHNAADRVVHWSYFEGGTIDN